MANFKHIIRNFSGGLLEDKRVQSPTHFSTSKHFDTFTYPAKLVPYVQTDASLGLSGGGSVTALGIVKFLYAQNQNASIFRLYGFGQNGSGNCKVYKFDINAGNPGITNWFAATNGESNTGARCNDVFFYYKGYIYMLAGGNSLDRYDTTEVNAFGNGWQTVPYTNTAASPVWHPSDDIAYFFGDNTVYSLNGTSWNGAVLQLPSNQKITCATPFGNYLALGCVTTGTLDIRSTVYLWDRDSSLTTLSDRIDFGAGSLVHLASLNNKLMGVMNYYTNNFYSLNKGKVFIKAASGSFASTINTLTTDSTSASQFTNSRVVIDNKLYFPMSVPLNGDPRLGIWCVDESGKAALDFIEPAAVSFDGIFLAANQWWIAHSGNGSVTYSDVNGGYSGTNPSVWESLIVSTVNVTNRGTIIMNSSTNKKLVGVVVTHEPLQTGQSVIVRYRYNAGLNNGTWRYILTSNVLGTTDHHAINHEDDESNFPDYNEIQFRVESYGGAVITGIQYGGEIVDNDLF